MLCSVLCQHVKRRQARLAPALHSSHLPHPTKQYLGDSTLLPKPDITHLCLSLRPLPLVLPADSCRLLRQPLRRGCGERGGPEEQQARYH